MSAARAITARQFSLPGHVAVTLSRICFQHTSVQISPLASACCSHNAPNLSTPPCPALPAAGTEFMEMFVGVGASRVRDMFQQARTIVSARGWVGAAGAGRGCRGHGFAG